MASSLVGLLFEAYKLSLQRGPMVQAGRPRKRDGTAYAER